MKFSDSIYPRRHAGTSYRLPPTNRSVPRWTPFQVCSSGDVTLNIVYHLPICNLLPCRLPDRKPPCPPSPQLKPLFPSLHFLGPCFSHILLDPVGISARTISRTTHVASLYPVQAARSFTSLNINLIRPTPLFSLSFFLPAGFRAQ